MKTLYVVIATLMVANTGLANEFILVDVDSGLGPAPIVLFPNAPPRTRDAAITLADYVEKTCGDRPDLIDRKPETIPDRAIWVGVQPACRQLFPDVDFDFKYPEETLIAANDRYLVIAGRDRWEPDQMEAKGRLAMITGRQQEYGTANAVYTFLQDYLKVRWLWPGETGEDIVPQKRLAFGPFRRRFHPQIRSRGGMFVKLSLGNNTEGPDEVWTRFQRVQLDSLQLAGGHAFHDWWDKYHQQYPDYFALQPDGSRGGWPAPNYVNLMEQARTEMIQGVRNRYRAFDIPAKYTPEFFRKAEALLEQAEAKVGDTKKYRDRIAFVRCGLDYARLVVDTRSKMQRFEASQCEDNELRAQILANWEEAQQMKATFPDFAINWITAFRQPEHKRMMGLHPDNPVASRVKREFETRE